MKATSFSSRWSSARRFAGAWLCLLAVLVPSLATAATAPLPDKKWNPGHYVLYPIKASLADKQAAFDDVRDNAILQGIQVRYFWGDLEPAQGVYDPRLIDEDLAMLAPGKKLVIVLMDRKFGNPPPNDLNFLPENLRNEASIMRTYSPPVPPATQPTLKSINSKVWEISVMDQLIALHHYLANRYDGNPKVEGITGEETAIPTTSDPNSGYTHDKLAAQLKRQMIEMQSIWQETNIFAYTNYIGSQARLAQLMLDAEANQVGIGGPDVLPDAPAPIGHGNARTHGMKLIAGEAFGGVVYPAPTYGDTPIAYAAQQPEFGGHHGNFNGAELLGEANDYLKANYVFWFRSTANVRGKWTTNLLPHLRNNALTNTKRPRNYPPEAPTNLAATAVSVGANQINLFWTVNSLHHAGLELDRATNDTFTQSLTTISFSFIDRYATSYSDTNALLPGIRYYYRIRATKASPQDSANSNPVSARTHKFITFNPNHDAFLESGIATGINNTELHIERSTIPSRTRRSYLRFNVAKIDGAITGAILKLKNTDTSNRTGVYKIFKGSDQSWNEAALTTATAPTTTGSVLDTQTNVTAGAVVNMEVGSAVAGNGVVNFVLVADTTAQDVKFSSKEGGTKPVLEITYVPTF